MRTPLFIQSVRSQATDRLAAGTLECRMETVESVLARYLAGDFGDYELTLEAVEEVLQIAEHEATGIEPSRSRGIAFRSLHMLAASPVAELLGARAQALVVELVAEARREIMENALGPVELPVQTEEEAAEWIKGEARAAEWTGDERGELDGLRADLLKIAARIKEIDAGGRDLDSAPRVGIELPVFTEDGGLSGVRIAQVTSCRGGLPALAEHTSRIVNATGVPAPSATLHILTGADLQYAPVTMTPTRFAAPLPGGHTATRQEVQFLFKSPDVDQTDMMSLHRRLREMYDAEFTRSIDAEDVELARLVWSCLDKFSVPPSASFPFKSYGVTTVQLFETVRAQLMERGKKVHDWRGPYQKYRRITDNLDRTISVIRSDEDAPGPS